MPHAPRLPFAHVNLRFNPFGELAPAARAELAVVDVMDAARRLRAPGAAVQFVGRHGRGKSTHLLALQRALEGVPLHRVELGRMPTIEAAPLVLLDGLDHVPRRRRRDLCSRVGSIAVTTHVDLRRDLRAAGLEVVTRRVGGRDVELVARVVERRIEHARRGPGPVPRVPESEIRRLVRRHGDDVRAIESRLYDVFQGLREVGDVEV